MRFLSNVFFMAAMISLCCANPVAAGLIPVLEYQFPASSSDLVTNTTITDLSSGAHNATASGFAATGLSSNVPTGMSGSSASFTGGTAETRIATNDTALLNNTAIGDAGGFTWDLWLYATDTTGFKKVIDYAGTDALAITSGSISFLGATKTISTNTWYHVIATFNTAGNTAIPDTTNGGYQITGIASLSVNGDSADPITVTKSGLGDTLLRPIGIGNHPTTNYGEGFIGDMYDVKISLGVASIPEPSSMLILSSGAFALLAYAWRKRK